MQDRLTIIISYYKAPQNLLVILDALRHQSCMDFEVIISEDDRNEDTVLFLETFRQTANFEIHHLHQESDEGFRKNEMLNKSLRECRTEQVAFIDGDCIPHRHFVRAYLEEIQDGIFLGGRAVMLGEKLSARILQQQSVAGLTFLKVLLSDARKKKEGLYFPILPLSHKIRGLSGRNWGVMKKHLLEINGFDEDYRHAGVGEDVDIEWRLMAHGLEKKSIKNKAIVYHLYHPRGYGQQGVQENYAMLKRKKEANHIRCLHGLETLT
jgi:glycosyltransferase involved in cell wall biosynthesis